MSPRQLSFAVAALLLFVLLLSTVLYYARRARRLSGSGWQDLLMRLKQINRENISALALDLSGESEWGEHRPELPTERIRALVGSLEDLEALEANCAVLIDMAAYVQRWYPEAGVIAEELRRDARAVSFHVERLKAAAERGNLESWIADYGQRAASSYYSMTQRVLGLFEAAHMPELAELRVRL